MFSCLVTVPRPFANDHWWLHHWLLRMKSVDLIRWSPTTVERCGNVLKDLKAGNAGFHDSHHMTPRCHEHEATGEP